MKKEDFIYNDNCETPLNGSSHWESPSNIALVKYWGKSDVQIPKNLEEIKDGITNNKLLLPVSMEGGEGLENDINNAPSFWLWTHNRWKKKTLFII